MGIKKKEAANLARSRRSTARKEYQELAIMDGYTVQQIQTDTYLTPGANGAGRKEVASANLVP
jgi:2-keto-4-pentenoate hydratase